MTLLLRLMAVAEILGGSRPLPARFATPFVQRFVVPVWWAVLLLGALAFMGYNVKFIYIDF
jgi:hypothetical protein